MAIALLWLTWSVSGALLAPGTDSITARLAEWARDNELGWVVDGLEQIQYDLNPPAVGGTIAGGIPTVSSDPEALSPGAASNPPRAIGSPLAQPTPSPTGAVSGPPTTAPTPTPSSASSQSAGAGSPLAPPTPGSTPRPTPSPTPALEPIPPQVTPPLPSEGVWQNLIVLHGQPAIRVAFLRPDPAHTSYLDSVVWLDQNLVKFVLHPGYQQPGGSGWSQTDEVQTSERSNLLATFNSGFRLQDANGGYWEGGQTAVPLRPGAASMVFYKDGHVDIVKWGTAQPAPDVAAVRQNLVLLVDHGSITPEVYDQSQTYWGLTFTGASFVWRSALGIRADGSLVFVIGPALSIRTLATIERAAGAVRAIELDINPPWTAFITYKHPSGGGLMPHLLTNDEQSNPYRYLVPSSRDFVAVLGR